MEFKAKTSRSLKEVQMKSPDLRWSPKALCCLQPGCTLELRGLFSKTAYACHLAPRDSDLISRVEASWASM